MPTARAAGCRYEHALAVDSHVAAALEKLGTRTRKEAAARAGDLGILDPRR